MASSTRRPVTRERVVAAALALADERGVAAVTMRSVAQAVGVQPMSLYHHMAGKEQILDGIVDAVFGEIAVPRVGGPWRAEIARRCESAREVLVRHPWAVPLLETRTSPGPNTLRHHNAVIGTLREGGMPLALAAEAFVIIDAYVFGFVLQQTSLPFDTGSAGELDERAAIAEPIMADFAADEHPYLVELAVEHVLQPGYDFAAQFDVGLDLVLDGLEARLR